MVEYLTTRYSYLQSGGRAFEPRRGLLFLCFRPLLKKADTAFTHCTRSHISSPPVLSSWISPRKLSFASSHPSSIFISSFLCSNGTRSECTSCTSTASLRHFWPQLASSGSDKHFSQLSGTGPSCDLTNDQADNVHNLLTFAYCLSSTRLPCTPQIKYALFGPPSVDFPRAHPHLATSQVCCHLHGPVNNDSFGSGCLFDCTTPCTSEANVQQ